MVRLIDRLRPALRLPGFEDEDTAYQAQLAYLFAWVIALVSLLYGAYNLATSEGELPITELAPVLVVSVSSFLLVFLIRRGAVRMGSLLLVAVVWAGLAYLSYSLGGIGNPGYASFIIVIMMAGLLLGAPGAIAIAVLSALMGWVLVRSELGGTLPVDTDTPTDVIINYLILFVLSTGLVLVANRGLQVLLGRLQRNARELRGRNQDLQQMLDSLEVRVAERIEDLERRTRYLEGAARLAQLAGGIRDVDQLMHESVELVRDVFGLDYVSIFVVDGTGEWAVLRAVTGDAGAAMVARGHRIRVGSGLIGWSIAQGKSRVTQQAVEDGVRVVPPELLDTRAEAALPLRAGERVLGALTVQSTQPGFFDEATVTALQTIADLLAVALNTASLFEESQQSIAVARRAYGERVSGAWSDLLQSREPWGYRYADGIVLRADRQPHPAIREAISAAGMVERQEDGTLSLALPLEVGGQVVGAINYQRRAAQGGWDAEEIALLKTVTQQLAQALDSARLLQESQRWAAREQQINEIAAHVSESIDMDSMLRSVVDDLGRLPGVLEASVHIGLPQAPPPNGSDAPGSNKSEAN